jgi:hypothetical protein
LISGIASVEPTICPDPDNATLIFDAVTRLYRLVEGYEHSLWPGWFLPKHSTDRSAHEDIEANERRDRIPWQTEYHAIANRGKVERLARLHE